MVAGRFENKGELNACMPSGFQTDVVPPPQSAADASDEYHVREMRGIKLSGHHSTLL